MSIEKSTGKIKYPFTAIPNFILAQFFNNELPEAEFKLIALFLSNKPGFKYSQAYLRSYFSPKTLLKYIPILIEKKFLIRTEAPMPGKRYRVNYSVRPTSDWDYQPKTPEKPEPIFEENPSEVQNGIWFPEEPLPASDRFPSEPVSPENDHNGRRSGENEGGSERYMVPLGRFDGFPWEPSNKIVLTRLPKDVTKGGRDFREPPVDNSFPDRDTGKPCPPYKGKVISKTYLAGRVQQIYRFIARNAALTLITDLLQRFPPDTINAAINVALANSESKFFREYRPAHFQNWVTECENQRQTHEIDKLNAENDMSAITLLSEKNNVTAITKTNRVIK